MIKHLNADMCVINDDIFGRVNTNSYIGPVYVLMLGLHRITTNLGPIYELKNSGFLGLVSSRENFIVKSQAGVYIDFVERLI